MRTARKSTRITICGQCGGVWAPRGALALSLAGRVGHCECAHEPGGGTLPRLHGGQCDVGPLAPTGGTAGAVQEHVWRPWKMLLLAVAISGLLWYGALTLAVHALTILRGAADGVRF